MEPSRADSALAEDSLLLAMVMSKGWQRRSYQFAYMHQEHWLGPTSVTVDLGIRIQYKFDVSPHSACHGADVLLG